MITSACLLFATCLLSAPPGQDDAAKETKALAGTWKVIRAEERGKEVPEEERKHFQLQVEGNTFTFSLDGTKMAATFKLNPAANPKELDITWTDGPEKDKTVKCVYELKGDTFSFRAGSKNGSSDRPKSLTEGGEILLVFKKNQ